MPGPAASKKSGDWRKIAAVILLAPIVLLGLVVLGVGAFLLAVVEKLAGVKPQVQPEPRGGYRDPARYPIS